MRAVLVVILGTLVLRLLVSRCLDLDFMESYGAVVARYPSLSYFDQPPLTWWLIGAVTRLFGTEVASVVRLPFIVVFSASTWLLFRITARLFSPRAAFYAASAFSVAPLFGIYDGGLAQTNGLMEVFVLGAVWSLMSILFRRDGAPGAFWPAWIVAGLCFGLALASKYTTILLVPGFLLFLVTAGPDTRRWLSKPQLYVAGLAACIPMVPVLIWNAEHGWISFLYQGSRANWGEGLHVARALRWFAVQILILQPWIFAVVVVAFVRGLAGGPAARSVWFLCCLSLVPLTLFPGVMLWGSHPIRGYHWASIGYLLLFPLVGAAIDRLADRRPAAARGWLVLTGAVYCATLTVLVTHAETGWLAALAPTAVFAKQDPVLLELFDWSDLPKALRERGVDPATTFVTATRWEECAKAAYVLKDDYRVLCLADDNIHFSYIADPADFAGQDAIVVDRYASLDAVKDSLAGHFAAIEAAPAIPLSFVGRPMTELKAYTAHGFDGTRVAPPAGGKARQ